MPTYQEAQILELKSEIERLNKILNTPLIEEFFEAAKAEARHQASRSDEYHDDTKTPSEWFWLIGYLAGKALQAHITGDRRKALHHTISSAAALMHWHQAIKEQMPDNTKA